MTVLIIAYTVILASWLLNAAMDAIDHGKGNATLMLTWHILKWLSYALPYGLIMRLTNMPPTHILLLVLVMWILWERLYKRLRETNFYKHDR